MEKGFVSAHKKKIGAQSIPSNPRKSGWEDVRGASHMQSQEQTEISATVARVQHQIRQACLFYLAASTAPFSTM